LIYKFHVLLATLIFIFLRNKKTFQKKTFLWDVGNLRPRKKDFLEKILPFLNAMILHIELFNDSGRSWESRICLGLAVLLELLDFVGVRVDVAPSLFARNRCCRVVDAVSLVRDTPGIAGARVHKPLLNNRVPLTGHDSAIRSIAEPARRLSRLERMVLNSLECFLLLSEFMKTEQRLAILHANQVRFDIRTRKLERLCHLGFSKLACREKVGN